MNRFLGRRARRCTVVWLYRGMFGFGFACFVGSIILGEGDSRSTHDSRHPDQQSRSPHVMNRIPLCNERVKRMRGWKPRSTRVKGNERNTVKRMTRVEKERKGKVDGEPQQSGPIRLINIPPCTPLACIARFIAERHKPATNYGQLPPVLNFAGFISGEFGTLSEQASHPLSTSPCANMVSEGGRGSHTETGREAVGSLSRYSDAS
jgi:hypothetical protein